MLQRAPIMNHLTFVNTFLNTIEANVLEHVQNHTTQEANKAVIEICKATLKSSKKCTNKAKSNGFCGKHQNCVNCSKYFVRLPVSTISHNHFNFEQCSESCPKFKSII